MSTAHDPLGYALADADNHYYEPDDCFTRHIAPVYRDRAVKIDRSGGDGVPHLLQPDPSMAQVVVEDAERIVNHRAVAW